MRLRTTLLIAALIGFGALLGRLASTGRVSTTSTALAQSGGTPTVLPRPDFHFPGNIGRTYQDSDPARFPQPVPAPKAIGAPGPR